MIKIIINDNITNIETSDLQINISGAFELKKKGAEAPIINVIEDNHKIAVNKVPVTVIIDTIKNYSLAELLKVPIEIPMT